MTTYTRQDYLAGKVSHNDYFAQFVTASTRRQVTNTFSVESLTKELAKDEHLNGIPLRKWDVLTWHHLGDNPWPSGWQSAGAPFAAHLAYDQQAITEAGETVTRSVLVSIAKTAARQIVTEQQQN